MKSTWFYRQKPAFRYRRPWLETLEWRQLLHASDLLAAEAAAEAEPPQVVDFSLLDVNENSETYNQQVSPRDYLGGVSAYYFGSAT